MSTHLLKAIPLSFYSKPLYQEVRNQWKRRSFVYLLVLLSLCWFVLSCLGVFHLLKSGIFGKEINYIVSQMPMIHFQEGTASTVKPGPFYIKRKTNHNELFAIIAPQHSYHHLEKSTASIFVLKHEILVKKGSSIRTYPFPKTFSGHFGARDLKTSLNHMKNWTILIIIFIYPVGLALLYIYNILQSLAYALIGLLLAKILKRKIEYSDLISLAIVAMTPAILFLTLASFLYFPILPYMIILSLFISLGYLLFAIKANPREQPIPSTKSSHST